MKLRKGMVVWSYFVFEGKVELQEWVLRTIRTIKRNFLKDEKRAFFVQKNRFTWVKLSKKHFDYGWAKNIHSSYRRYVDLSEGCLPPGLYTTKLQAARAALKKRRGSITELYPVSEKQRPSV